MQGASSTNSTAASVALATLRLEVYQEQNGSLTCLFQKELKVNTGASFSFVANVIKDSLPAFAQFLAAGGKADLCGRLTEKDSWLKLEPNVLVADAFPAVIQAGHVLQVLLTALDAPSGHGVSSSAHAPDSAPADDATLKAAAKRIKALGRLNVDHLLDHLRRTAPPGALKVLTELEAPPSAGSGNSGGGGGGSVQFTLWYQEVKKCVEEALNMYAHPGSVQGVDLTIMVQDRHQRFEQFEASQRASNVPDSVNPVRVMKRWVAMVEEAASTNQRLAMLHYITLGRRLSMAKELWQRLSKSSSAHQLRLHTEDDFFAFLSVKYTRDYRRKLMQVGLMGEAFPNLALISCCGIGDLLKFRNDFLKTVKESTAEGTFWRRDGLGSMQWQRRTNLMSVEDSAGTTKRRKVIDLTEDAPNETYHQWHTRSQTVVQTVIAEEEAARKEAAEKEQQHAEAVDKVRDAMNGL